MGVDVLAVSVRIVMPGAVVDVLMVAGGAVADAEASVVAERHERGRRLERASVDRSRAGPVSWPWLRRRAGGRGG